MICSTAVAIIVDLQRCRWRNTDHFSLFPKARAAFRSALLRFSSYPQNSASGINFAHLCYSERCYWMSPDPRTQQESAGIEHIDGLYGYALVLTQNRTDAEDLVQETYVRAIRAMGRLRDDSNVKGWLFTILRNIWLNELRRRNKAPESVDVDADETHADLVDKSAKNPHDVYVQNLERHHVRKAMQQLPEEAREVILLREWEQLSYQEIATILDCPVGTVMSRLARARAKLRHLLCLLLPSSYPCGESAGATE
jgi:RNA polymerase sigma-70 factor, ECF subfamily